MKARKQGNALVLSISAKLKGGDGLYGYERS